MRPNGAGARAVLAGWLVLVFGGAAGCTGEAAQTTEKTAQAVEQTCPQLTSSTDPLAYSYSSDAPTNAKLRSFVAAARGLSDASKKMEALTSEACAKMSQDLGLSPPSASAGVEAACAPVGNALQRLKASGIQIRITVGLPSCTPSQEQRGQCEGQCPPGDTACAAGCATRGDVYARCTLPRIDVELSASSEQGNAAAATLRSNLPRLVYAEAALGQRLIGHVQTLARVGSQLPSSISKTGLFGMACIVASVAATAEAGVRIEAALQGAAALGRPLSL